MLTFFQKSDRGVRNKRVVEMGCYPDFAVNLPEDSPFRSRWEFFLFCDFEQTFANGTFDMPFGRS